MSRADIIAALRNALLRRPEADRNDGWRKAMADIPRLVEWAAEKEATTALVPLPASPNKSNGTATVEPAAEPPPLTNETDIDASQGSMYADDTLALVFAEQHAEQLRHVAVWGQWFLWNGRFWQPDDTLRVFSLVRLMLRQAAHNCTKRRVAQALGSAHTVAAVERLTRADRRLVTTDQQWNRPPRLLTTPRGTPDLNDPPQLDRPHRREDYLTRCTTVAPDPTASCPTWMRFLRRITNGDAAVIAYLQRVCGYCLTGETAEHVMFFLWGTGANGKSTFASVLLGILGIGATGYAAVAPISTFDGGNHDQHPTDLAMLRDVRLVVAHETEDNRSWPIAKLKMMASGDPISARLMRQDFFTYTPRFKVMVLGNHKPRLRSVDEAIRRRIHLIPFTVTIPAAERDPDLAEKLRAEYPAILWWMIGGCLAWQQNRLSPPPAVTSATIAYLAGEDLVQRWIDDECVLGAFCREHSTALYLSFRLWLEAAGEKPPSQKWFSQALADHGFQPFRAAQAGGFKGLALRPSTTPVSDEVPI